MIACAAAAIVAGWVSFAANATTIITHMRELRQRTQSISPQSSPQPPIGNHNEKRLLVMLAEAKTAYIRRDRFEEALTKIYLEFPKSELEKLALSGILEAYIFLYFAKDRAPHYKIDKDSSIAYLLQASEAGSGFSDHLLSLGIDESVYSSIISRSEITKRSAERGDASGQFWLGFYYYRGDRGFSQDLEQAEHWFRQSSEQGCRVSTHFLAQLYIYDLNKEDIGKIILEESVKNDWFSSKKEMVNLEITGMPFFMRSVALSVGKSFGAIISERGILLAQELLNDPRATELDKQQFREWLEK